MAEETCSGRSRPRGLVIEAAQVREHKETVSLSDRTEESGPVLSPPSLSSGESLGPALQRAVESVEMERRILFHNEKSVV